MRRGFTLIEIIVVLGVVALLLVLTSANLLIGQRNVSKTGTTAQIMADIRSQQSRAMLGDNNGSSFGVHINQDNYVLFSGSVYNALDAANFVVSLDNNIFLSTTFANSNIIFTPVSGEVTGFVVGADTITTMDTTDETIEILHVNKYGVIDSQT